jgi:hypothetical protein
MRHKGNWPGKAMDAGAAGTQCRCMAELAAFETVRRVADEDVRALTAVAADCAEVVAARSALEAATTAEDVIALEHLVVAAWCELRLRVADERMVEVVGRLVPWDELGCYRGIVEAATRAAR